MIWLYRLIWLFMLPVVILLLLWRVIRGKESFSRLPERFGVTRHPRPEGPLLWLHCASVGESFSVLPLIEQLLATRPDLHILMTTGTRTSAGIMGKQLQELPGGDRTIHQYVPLDFWPCVTRFYNTWQPTVSAFVESEFWPELVTTAKPILLNARVSDRSFPRYRKYAWFFGRIIRQIPYALAQREEDARRLRAMGVAEAHEAGNLKFDAAPLTADEETLVNLLVQTEGRTVLVAASTHPGEEEQIANLHYRLAPNVPNLLTILAPRHPHRGADIAHRLGCPHRKKTPEITPETSLYVADTLGEMGLWFRLSQAVIVGGSLVAHGGHNPLEPLKIGKVTLAGPYMFNFKDMLPGLIGQNLLHSVSDLDELAEKLQTYLTDPAAREEQEAHIAATMPTLTGATEHTVSILLNALEGRNQHIA